MFCVLKCGSFSWGSALLMEGGVAESENCYFNSVHSSSSLFSLPPTPFRAQSKKVTTQRNPNQDRKCGLICCMLVPRCGARDCSPQAHAQLQLQSRHENAPGEKTHEATQHACDYFWNSRCSAQPSASSQVTTRGLNNQTRAALVPLKIPWYKVRMFSWHGPNPDSLSIMTFSEIGPGSRKSNAFDRCLSLQLQKKKKKSRYTEREGQKHLEREREREKAGYCGF